MGMIVFDVLVGFFALAILLLIALFFVKGSRRRQEPPVADPQIGPHINERPVGRRS